MKRSLIYILGGVMVCAGIVYLILVINRGHSLVDASQKQSAVIAYKTPKPAPKTKKQAQPKQPTQITIVYDKYGFVPNEIKVPVGMVIEVKNETIQTLNFQALSYNSTYLAGLNIGDINPGGSGQFVVSEVGSWQFQANGNPAIRGDIAGFTPNGQWYGLSPKELPQYNPSTKTLLINYTDYGFVPNIVSVPVGTKVTILNSTDEGGMDFEELSSDPTPNPSLSLGIIHKGKSASFILTKPGTWHYVNTWETTDVGEITAN